MDVHSGLSVLRRRAAIIAAVVAAACALAWITTPKAAKYQAESVIYVGPRQFLTTPGKNKLAYDPTLIVSRLIRTYAVMAASEPVATDALSHVHAARTVDALRAETSVDWDPDLTGTAIDPTTGQLLPGTQLLHIRVTERDATAARDLANAIANSFVSRVQSLESEGPVPEGTPPAVPAYVFQPATRPTTPLPSPRRDNIFIGAALGFVVSVVAVVSREYFDITLKNPSDAEARLDLAVLGTIPLYGGTPTPTTLAIASTASDSPAPAR